MTSASLPSTFTALRCAVVRWYDIFLKHTEEQLPKTWQSTSKSEEKHWMIEKALGMFRSKKPASAADADPPCYHAYSAKAVRGEIAQILFTEFQNTSLVEIFCLVAQQIANSICYETTEVLHLVGDNCFESLITEPNLPRRKTRIELRENTLAKEAIQQNALTARQNITLRYAGSKTYASGICFPLKTPEHFEGTISLFTKKPQYALSENQIQALDPVLPLIQNFLEFHRYAFRDHRTGLPNRKLFCLEVDRMFRSGLFNHIAIVYTDVNGFKQVNDARGKHEDGNVLLRELAARLKKQLRNNDIAARIERGDEFAIALPFNENFREVPAMLRSMFSDIERPYHIGGLEFRISFSAGISLYPEHGNDCELLLLKADEAMFVAKKKVKARKAGKSAYSVWRENPKKSSS